MRSKGSPPDSPAEKPSQAQAHTAPRDRFHPPSSASQQLAQSIATRKARETADATPLPSATQAALSDQPSQVASAPAPGIIPMSALPFGASASADLARALANRKATSPSKALAEPKISSSAARGMPGLSNLVKGKW